MFRYFSILVLAYLYITKYTVEEKDGYYPFVSIIVPVYNEGKVLADSISSLLDLDYPNYEILIVNDGSKDNTAEVAETLVGYRQGRTSLVKVSLINKPNGGKSKALNAGIQYSEADFVLLYSFYENQQQCKTHPTLVYKSCILFPLTMR